MAEFENPQLELDDEEDDVRTSEDKNILDNFLDKAIDLTSEEEGQTDALMKSRRGLPDEFVQPTDQDVIEQTQKVYGRLKQIEYAEQFGYEDEEDLVRATSVNIKMSPPEELVYEFGIALELLHDDFLTRITARNGDDKTNPIVETEEPTMSQVMHKNVGKHNHLTILHGSRNIIYNLSDQLGFSQEERRFVQIAHRIAARRNKFYAQTLVDDVVIINQRLSETL